MIKVNKSQNTGVESSNATLIAIEERRRRIAELLQENKTQVQISEILHCDASTISNDITALKDQAVTYLYDLCKQDLCFFYHQTIADIDHVRGECWNMYHSTNKKITPKDRLQALRTMVNWISQDSNYLVEARW